MGCCSSLHGSPTGDANSSVPYISYYSFATQQLTRIATAPTEPDGSTGEIVNATYAGDWISYEATNALQANGVFRAYNVVTGQHIQMASSGAGSGAIGIPWQSWVANPTDLVWSSVDAGSNGGTWSLYDYTFRTSQTRTLTSSSTAVIKPAAINSTAVLFFEDSEASNSPAGATWLQQLDQAAPVKIADEDGVGASMNAIYAVWAIRTQTRPGCMT